MSHDKCDKVRDVINADRRLTVPEVAEKCAISKSKSRDIAVYMLYINRIDLQFFECLKHSPYSPDSIPINLADLVYQVIFCELEDLRTCVICNKGFKGFMFSV